VDRRAVEKYNRQAHFGQSAGLPFVRDTGARLVQPADFVVPCGAAQGTVLDPGGIMSILAQAVAEYGGTISRTGGGSLDGVLQRMSNASGTDYLVVGAGILLAMYLIGKLLDAA
jgi:hypothetical protein